MTKDFINMVPNETWILSYLHFEWFSSDKTNKLEIYSYVRIKID